MRFLPASYQVFIFFLLFLFLFNLFLIFFYELESIFSFRASKNLFISKKKEKSPVGSGFLENSCFPENDPMHLSTFSIFTNDYLSESKSFVDKGKKPCSSELVDKKQLKKSNLKSESEFMTISNNKDKSTKDFKSDSYVLKINDMEIGFIKEKKVKTNEKQNQCWKTNPYKNLIFSPNVSNEIFYEHLANVYKGLIYAKHRLLSEPHEKSIQKRLVKLTCTFFSNFSLKFL